MKITKLEIERFRNLKNLTLDFPSDKNVILLSGKNGIGKSTILDSIMWLLCDETLIYGGQNDDNLDKNDRKSPIAVCGTFIKDDGTEIKFKRTLTPKFKKTGEFSNYDNLLEINDIEYKVSPYFARIKNEELGIKSDNDPNVSSFNTLRCILDYNYLNIIKYQTAREKIEKILKIAKDEDLVKNAQYSLIKDELKAALFDVAKVKTKLNKQKSIAEATVEKLNDSYVALKNAYKPIDTEELEKLEAQKKSVSEMEYEHSVEYKVAVKNNDELKLKLNNAKNKFDSIEYKYNSKLKEYKNIENYKIQYKNQLDILRTKFMTVKNSTTKCPKCNYELNGDEIKKQLDQINDEGQTINEEIKKCDCELAGYDIKALEQEYNEAKKIYNDTYNAVMEEESKLKDLIDKENIQSREFYNQKAIKLSELTAKIDNLKASSNSIQLESKEKELKVARQELAVVEEKIALIKEYEVTKNKAINIRIKEVFPNLDFRLWEESDTGAIQNTCKVYLKNVGYEGINTGHKIMVGLEIINSLRKAFGVTESLPVIFDNVSDLDQENFTSLVRNTKNQIITAVVNNEDTIRVVSL